MKNESAFPKLLVLHTKIIFYGYSHKNMKIIYIFVVVTIKRYDKKKQLSKANRAVYQ